MAMFSQKKNQIELIRMLQKLLMQSPKHYLAVSEGKSKIIIDKNIFIYINRQQQIKVYIWRIIKKASKKTEEGTVWDKWKEGKTKLKALMKGKKWDQTIDIKQMEKESERYICVVSSRGIH